MMDGWMDGLLGGGDCDLSCIRRRNKKEKKGRWRHGRAAQEKERENRKTSFFSFLIFSSAFPPPSPARPKHVLHRYASHLLVHCGLISVWDSRILSKEWWRRRKRRERFLPTYLPTYLLIPCIASIHPSSNTTRTPPISLVLGKTYRFENCVTVQNGNFAPPPPPPVIGKIYSSPRTQ